jgi:hypothetical protein
MNGEGEQEPSAGEASVVKLHHIIEEQRFTESVLRKEIEKLRNEVRILTTLDIVKMREDTNRLRKEKEVLSAQCFEFKDRILQTAKYEEIVIENRLLKQQCEVSLSTTADLKRKKWAAIEHEGFVAEMQKFRTEQRAIKRGQTLLEIALEEEVQKNRMLQAQLRCTVNSRTTQKEHKNNGGTRLVLGRVGKVKRTTPDVRNCGNRHGEGKAFSQVFLSKKMAALKVELETTRNKLSIARKNVNTLRSDFTPMQSEVLLLRDQNAVLQRQLENIRREHLVHLAIEKTKLSNYSTKRNPRNSHARVERHNMGKTILSTTSTIYEKNTLLADSVVPTMSKQYQGRSAPKPFPEATQSISNHAPKTRRPKLSSLLTSKQMKRTNRNESGF